MPTNSDQILHFSGKITDVRLHGSHMAVDFVVQPEVPKLKMDWCQWCGEEIIVEGCKNTECGLKELFYGVQEVWDNLIELQAGIKDQIIHFDRAAKTLTQKFSFDEIASQSASNNWYEIKDC